MAKAAKPKAATKSKAKAAAKSKMAVKSDVRVFSVDTRFQKMARREGGIPRDKAIEQAQNEIREVKSHFDSWFAGELKVFVRLIKKVEGAKAGKDWIKTANFHSHQLRDSATTLGFELLAFIAGSLCRILDSRPTMCLRGNTGAPAFAANQRHPLLSGRLPLSARRVISRVPPCLCNDRLIRRFGFARSNIVTDARGRTGPRTRNESNCTNNPDQ
jgi:hypothetical protein